MALTEVGARLRLAGAPAFKRDASKAADGLGRLGKEAGQADRKVTGLERAAGKAGGSLGRMGKAAALGLAGLAAGGVAAGVVVLGDSIQKAATLGETLSKTNNVFKGSAKEIVTWSRTSARAFGLSQQEALAAASQYGNMFLQLGFTDKAAVASSKNMVKLAADLGSFNDVEPSDVIERMGAALRGEYDSLQALIPNINAARVETEALAMSGKKNAKQLTAQEKAAATLAIIQKDGALANNDFAETSDGLTNQQRILSAQIKDTKAQIGQGLLPVMSQLATYANDKIVPAIQRFVDQFHRGVGPGGEFKDMLGDVRDKAEEAWPHIQSVYEKTKSVVDFVIKHKDAFVAIAAGVTAYSVAMKAASIWTGAMAALNLGKMATGIGGVGAASATAAPGVAAFGSAAARSAGPIAGMAAALVALDSAGKLGFSSFGKGGAVDGVLNRLKDGDWGGALDEAWGNGFQLDEGFRNRINNEKPKPKPKAPIVTPRLGGSSNDRIVPGTSAPKTFRDQRDGGNLRTPLVVNVVVDKRTLGTAVLDNMEDRVARR